MNVDLTAIATTAAAFFAGLAVLIAIWAQRQSQEAQRDLQRPTLAPRPSPEQTFHINRNPENGSINFDIVPPPGNAAHAVDIENVGSGPATNIHGVVFGPPIGPFEQRDKRLTLITPHIITPGQPVLVEAAQGRTLVYGDSKVGTFRRSYTLAPEPPPAPAERQRFDLPIIVGRLTMTYRDTYRRKYASIFDLTDQGEWISVAFLKNIQHDLSELNRRDRERRLPK